LATGQHSQANLRRCGSKIGDHGPSTGDFDVDVFWALVPAGGL
jgi:hypothetical protein